VGSALRKCTDCSEWFRGEDDDADTDMAEFALGPWISTTISERMGNE
jgi:hypothetical protein